MKCILLLLSASLLHAAHTPGKVAQRIRDNDVSWLRENLLTAEDANITGEKNNTPLIVAAQLGSAEAVEYLLKIGADPNAANQMGMTALIGGATDAAKVKALLAAGANAMAKNAAGQHALIIAASSPRATESVRMLLKAGVPADEPGARKRTALLAAVTGTCAEASAKLLLAAGANVKVRDAAGFGVAHSVLSCDDAFVKDLIARGAPVNVAVNIGEQVRHGTVTLQEITPLMLAAAHRGPEMVKVLLDAGADVNAKDARGMTPLLFTVSSEDQDVRVIKLLLAKGANREAKDSLGQDAVAWARQYNNPAMLSVLGAKPAVPAYAPLSSSKGPGVQAALIRLEQGNETFFQESGCTGCHHSNLLAFAGQHAVKAGLTLQPGLVEARRTRNKATLTAAAALMQQMIPIPGDIDPALYHLLESKSLGNPRSPETELMARYLWAKQMPDGRWAKRGISRSPMVESDIHRTALAVYVLPDYSDATMKLQAPERLKEALKWLRASPTKSTDDLAMMVLGLRWSGAGSDEIAQAALNLMKAQQRNGSWAGNPYLPGDAYSTGVALFALREGAELKSDSKSIKSAVQWLLQSQRADGTWMVKTRSLRIQPPFESGFPYGDDQWISSAATAWAVAGLSEAGVR